ncbi:MAG TPA: hypothetical protein VKU41_31040 [Polyangiaceae bacterium]|nr:hypothetical protein [Polyangiaceae bacterium]
MATSRLRRTAFVPRVLVRGAILASVVPACALAACGGDDSTGSAADAAPDRQFLGVAAVAYPAYEAGRPGVDASPDVFFSVAAVAYPAYEAGAPDRTSPAPDAADGASDVTTRPDVFFGVAAVAYPAYEAGRG